MTTETDYSRTDGAITATAIKAGATPITVNCRQRSDEWYAARLGIPTASGFHRLITPEGKPRKGATPARYLADLVYERLFENIDDHVETWAMRRGVELEPHARAWYELTHGWTVETVGFVYGDSSRLWGCSPDGLVPTGKSKGGIEIKCPMRGGFAAALTGPLDEEYVLQAQGAMWVCGADWWDVVIYTEEGDKPYGHVYRVMPDAEIHAALAATVPAFAATVIETWRKASAALQASARRVTLKEIADRLGPDWAQFNASGEKDLSTGTMEASEL